MASFVCRVGRAGRYKGRYPDGTVACVSKSDHLTVKRALLDAVPQFHVRVTGD